MSKGEILFKKERKIPDQFLRCIVTLDCRSGCSFCSALIPDVSPERRAVSISAEEWALGINRRRRPVVFTGGEPFLYEEFSELLNMIDLDIQLRIYTNLQHDISQFLEEVDRPISFLVSLHPATPDLEAWCSRVRAVAQANHVQINMIGSGNWSALGKSLLEQMDGDDISSFTVVFDQRNMIKSMGQGLNEKYPRVRCSGKSFQYGPGGFRYICVKLMGLGGEFGRFEHISEPEEPHLLEVTGCEYFGLCAACSNLVEGVVESL